MTEITIQSDDLKAKQEVEKLLHQIAAKCRGAEGWSAAYVKQDDGSAQLVVAFPPKETP